MSTSTLTRRWIGAGSAVAAVLAAGTMLMLSGQASADPPSGDSGDPRATSYPGNVTTCAAAGLDGSFVEVTSTNDGTYIDITAVPEDVTITGVVVKGGPNYNVYLPGALGALPWTELHSPRVGQGNIPQISHWFVCGTENTTTTTTTEETTTPPTTDTTTTTEDTTTTTEETTTPPTTDTTTTTTGDTSTTTETTTESTTETTTESTTTEGSTTTPTTETTGTTSNTGTTSGTTSAAAGLTTVNGGGATPQSGLASTGFAGGWLVPAGVALLAVGAALLFLVRRRTT